MKINSFSMALPIVLFSTSVIACGSTVLADQEGQGEEMSVQAEYIPSAYRSTGLDFTNAAEKTVNAVVSIRTTTNAKSRRGYSDPFFEFFFGPNSGIQAEPQKGLGSGVIISDDGYIITNNHVIENADELEITLNDKRTFHGTIVGTDPTTDLALVKIDAVNLPTVKFGNSDDLKVGEWVLAVGNPFGLTSTVTAGIVSAKARRISDNTRGSQMDIESFIQTDAAVNPGNSGGALVNTAGELIGINTAIFSQTGNYAGYSFAIPSSIVSKVITDLRQYGTVQRAVLGISFQEINSELAAEKNIDVLEGVYVASVYDQSAAMEGGIEEGDVITHIDNNKIVNGAALLEQIGRHNPGDRIKVTVVRNGKQMVKTLTLKNNQGNTEVTTATSFGSLGVEFKDLTDAEKRKYSIRNGVVVEKVENGKFRDAGIREGFIIMQINDNYINSADDVKAVYDAISRSGSSDKAMFIKGIYPNGKRAYYAIDISQ